MSTFFMCDEYFVSGQEYDKAQGFMDDLGEGVEYEPCKVEFIRAWSDKTWDTEIVHVPLPMSHEKCSDDHLTEWYSKVHLSKRLSKTYIFFLGVIRK